MMMALLWNLFGRPLVAIQDSEKAHSRSLKWMRISNKIPPIRMLMKVLLHPRALKTKLLDWDLRGPIGLAAGMDKKAENVAAWHNMGFGFIEVGGFTAHPQEGNPKPRMFRSSTHKALINRMGFNNPGSEKGAETLAKVPAKARLGMPVFANLGRSKSTSNEDAPEDYSTSLALLWPVVEGFVVNVSSPNTPGLRDLQKGDALKSLLEACISMEEKCGGGKPVFVKIAPDLSNEALDHIIDVSRQCGCAGIVATNTTLERPQAINAKSETFVKQEGGLSGKPLNQRSTEVIHYIYAKTKGKWPIIGVGGISSTEDAWQKIINGASVVQIYSALVFKGPSVLKEIQKGLGNKLKQHGISSLSEAVGLAHRGNENEPE